MKTAVSIPDDVFAEAERAAKKLSISRSKLYSRALREFLARHQPSELTAAMDRVIEELGRQDETFTDQAAREVFERVEW